MNPPAFAKSSLLRIALVVAVLFTVVIATVKQADALLGHALAGAFGPVRAQYRSVWFDWSGNVTARHVVLQPPQGEAALRFDRVWLETPGWGFFLRHAVDRSLGDAPWPRLHLVFAELQDDAALPALVPGLGPLGTASGAMLETAGCANRRRFTREDLAAMGLSPGTTTLEIDERLDGQAVTRRVALDTPGSSRTQLDREGTLEAPVGTLLGARAPARIGAERWRVRDQGFVPARNRFCAAADGVPLRDFPERHLEGVDAFLQRAGLAVDENARAFYRRFARSGGEMSFGGEYAPPLTPAELAGARDAGRAFARMNATLERDTRAVPIVWRQVAVVADASPGAGGDPAVPGTAATPDGTPDDSSGRGTTGRDAAASSASATPPATPAASTPPSAPGTPATAPASTPAPVTSQSPAATASPSTSPTTSATSPTADPVTTSATTPATTSTTTSASTSTTNPAATSTTNPAAAPTRNPATASTRNPATASTTNPAATSTTPAGTSTTTPASTATTSPATTSTTNPAARSTTSAPASTTNAAATPTTSPTTPTTNPATTSATTPVSTSTPASSAPRPTRPRIERAPPAARRDALAWEDLAQYRGRRIRLWTVHNPPRNVELLEIAGDTARVRAKLGGGNAEYSVQRSGFIKAAPIR